MQSGTTTHAKPGHDLSRGRDFQHGGEPAPFPIVIIEQNTPALGILIKTYLGRAQIALVPDQLSGRRLLKSLHAQQAEILAVFGLANEDAPIPLSNNH